MLVSEHRPDQVFINQRKYSIKDRYTCVKYQILSSAWDKCLMSGIQSSIGEKVSHKFFFGHTNTSFFGHIIAAADDDGSSRGSSIACCCAVVTGG
ncbi:hypothetical protein Nepgr_020470 [Nepenthes gracilis]|uniref:Uncharacterized protein n=1 Tax=Nepenthes gracilis TaxID=150966 RepID=A0AAD3XW32_NEPGR|nr:hypothetical protein Nepgr_020470 [Nepenthes gracilis]